MVKRNILLTETTGNDHHMLKQTLQIVSYLALALLVGIVVTFFVNHIDDIAVEKSIRKSVEDDMKNVVALFKESAVQHASHEEKNFIVKFADTLMADKVIVREHTPERKPGDDDEAVFLLTLHGEDYALDVYLRKKFLKSELTVLDVPDYVVGIVATIIVFAFMVYFTENRKRTLVMKQQFESKHAELHFALEQQEALALVGRMSATLAHELKTPIATISNLVQVFPSRQLDEQFVKRFLALMHEELSCTQQLIDNLLAYGKEIDTQNNEWIAIESFFNKDSVNGFMLDIPQTFMVFGDKFYLNLLFKNLLRNSLEAGANTFSVRAVFPQDERTNHVEIACEDDGAGFSPTADLEKQTEPFVTSRSRGGGLGLYLAKKIVTAHGGTLLLYRLEKGAGVKIMLPGKRVRTNE